MAIASLQQDYTEKIIQDLGLANLPPGQQEKILQMAAARFERVVLVTVIKNLTPEQKTQFSQALDNPATMQDELTRITAQVPGLELAIEKALAEEYGILKSALAPYV